jgi:hypothetical protein
MAKKENTKVKHTKKKSGKKITIKSACPECNSTDIINYGLGETAVHSCENCYFEWYQNEA